MAKNCPNCGLENPSIAKFCMGCNTQLVEENQLSEEDKLRIQNADLREQVQELKKQKKALEKANADLLLSYNILKKENLLRSNNNILQKEHKETKQIVSNKTPNKKNANTPPQVGTGCWIFFWLFVVIIILLIITKKV